MPSPSPRRWNIVHSEASPGWGGQERRVLIELREFRKRGSQVRLIADTKSEIYQRSVGGRIQALFREVGAGLEKAEPVFRG